ncbi:CRISPR-associated endonuclease Cas3'' [Hominenteromicrobium sp.]|uniref:CRISPR-associated endonuclease Cas3'' n=1 Tax=Hominenteromicrobium sp. TaxID=3073581 RepID=UPI003AF5E951
MAKKLAHISEDHSREQTVYEHLTGTAELAKQFAAAFGAEEDGYLLGLLHDIGKYSDAFQHRLDGGVRVDHSTAGAKEACAHGVGYLALAIAGHHGGIPNFGSRADTKNDATLSGRLKRDLEPYDDWKTEVTLPPVKPFNMREFNTGFRLSFYIRMLFSCLVDADFIDTETFMDGALAPRGNYDALPALLDRLETYIAPWYPPKAELNRKRCAILDACKASGSTAAPGVYTLTVPTGGGKTTAAMAFALTAAVQNCMSRVIYAAPYTSIIDQNADTFEKIFGTENVIEHHSSAEYLFSESPNPAEYRKMLAAENWDAPVIATTTVQLFESLFASKPARCRKLHNLANSVLILDEVQTLPMPYLKPFTAALAELARKYGVIVVLCPAHRKARIKEIRERLKIGLPCRVVSTSLIEAGVDVDFPRVYREEAGLDSVLQAAGRCNREGKRPLDESLVTVFTVQNTTPPPYMRQPAAAMKNISKRMEDITSLAAIRAYFEFYRDLYGKEDLDREKILKAFESGTLPFASVAEKVRVIESCTTPVYIPIDQGEALVERLYRGERSRALFRKLGQYSVNVYPQQLAALREAGAVQSIDDGALYVLADPRRYDSALGLTLDQTETALFI